MTEETITEFNQRLCKKIPYEKHSVRCQLRMDNNSSDHWFCECDCHNPTPKSQDS